MIALAIVFPPDPPAIVQQLSKGELKRQRQRELAGVDPDRDILPIELEGTRYPKYRQRLMQRNPVCIYCGKKLTDAKATLDHAIPKIQGGLNQPWNLWLSCDVCNGAKADRSAVEWLDMIYQACIVMGFIDDPDEDDEDQWDDGDSTTG